MAHWDDIFDIEDFLNDNKADKRILKAWQDHMDDYNDAVRMRDDYRSMVKALEVIKDNLNAFCKEAKDDYDQAH